MSIVPLKNQSLENIKSELQNVPTLTERLGFRLQLETSESLKKLYQSQGHFTGSNLINFENDIKESFIDDIFEGQMICLTFRDENRNSFAAGIVYFRFVEKKEMKEWINESFIKKKLFEKNILMNDVQENSNALQPVINSGLNSENIFSSWMKIELIVTHPKYLGRNIGALLLASSLIFTIKHKYNYSILHLAGGTKNCIALNLYEKFGFSKAPEEMFFEPNDQLYILPNIYQSLYRYDWESLFKRALQKNETILLEN